MPRVGCLHHSIYMGKSFPYGNRLPYRNRSPRRPTLTRRSYCSTTAPTGLCGNRKPPARNVRGSRFAVAARSVRLTPIASNQDRSNYRREEDTGRHVAARVKPTSKSVPLPNRSARTTSPGMTRISRTPTPNHNPKSTKSHHNVRRKTVGGQICADFKENPENSGPPRIP